VAIRVDEERGKIAGRLETRVRTEEEEKIVYRIWERKSWDKRRGSWAFDS